MTESTIDRAKSVLFVVGSAAAAVLIVSGAIVLVAKMFGVDPSATFEWLSSIVAAGLGGAFGARLKAR